VKILYISQYYPPEIGAPAARVSELSRNWANSGHKVMVLTGFPNHPTGRVPAEYRGKLKKLFFKENDQGVMVHRTWLIPLPNRKAWERILNYASFAFSAALRGLFLPKPDVIIATSPQLLVGLSGLFVAKLRRIPLVFEVRDLWPESLEAVGLGGKHSLMVRVLREVARLLYRHSSHIVVVTEAFREFLVREWAVPLERISVVRNGVDHRLFGPGNGETISELGINGRFVVSYIGTIGNAHGLDTMLQAAEILQVRSPDILFVLLGEGAEKEKAARVIEEKALKNLRLLPAQARERIPDFIAASNVCLVLLKKAELFKTVIPTKMLEFMSCARPVIVAVEGESAELVQRAAAGICINPEDPRELATAILEMQKDAGACQRYGSNGRKFILAELTREQTAQAYISVLEDVAGLPSSS